MLCGRCRVILPDTKGNWMLVAKATQVPNHECPMQTEQPYLLNAALTFLQLAGIHISEYEFGQKLLLQEGMTKWKAFMQREQAWEELGLYRVAALNPEFMEDGVLQQSLEIAVAETVADLKQTPVILEFWSVDREHRLPFIEDSVTTQKKLGAPWVLPILRWLPSEEEGEEIRYDHLIKKPVPFIKVSASTVSD